VGMGTIENPNPSAVLYGFFAVLSCYYALRSGRVRSKLGFTAVCMVLLGFVALTQSNTGILSTMLCVTLVLVFHLHNKLITIGTGVIGVGLAGLYLLSSIGMLSAPADTGLTERLPIWRTVLEQVCNAPVFGNGYQKELLLTPSGEADAANYAHNAYLASARDGGLVGLVLQLLILLAGLRAALRIAKAQGDSFYVILLVFGFICMSADTDQLITRPRELWIIYWLPLAMILAQDALLIREQPTLNGKPLNRQSNSV
jgi:O-antigen ligase